MPRSLPWWLGVVAVAVGLGLLWAAPAGAQSPCDSEAVIPAGQEGWRSDCKALWESIRAWTMLAYWTMRAMRVLGGLARRSWIGTVWRPVRRGWSGLVWLRQLEHLYLPSNKLSGGIPVELGGLSKLRVLSRSRNRLEAPFLSNSGISRS